MLAVHCGCASPPTSSCKLPSIHVTNPSMAGSKILTAPALGRGIRPGRHVHRAGTLTRAWPRTATRPPTPGRRGTPAMTAYSHWALIYLTEVLAVWQGLYGMEASPTAFACVNMWHMSRCCKCSCRTCARSARRRGADRGRVHSSHGRHAGGKGAAVCGGKGVQLPRMAQSARRVSGVLRQEHLRPCADSISRARH